MLNHYHYVKLKHWGHLSFMWGSIFNMFNFSIHILSSKIKILTIHTVERWWQSLFHSETTLVITYQADDAVNKIKDGRLSCTAFHVAAACMWNDLSPAVVNALSISASLFNQQTPPCPCSIGYGLLNLLSSLSSSSSSCTFVQQLMHVIVQCVTNGLQRKEIWMFTDKDTL